jgi:hypothetical protein
MQHPHLNQSVEQRKKLQKEGLVSRRTAMAGPLTPSALLRSRTSSSAAITSGTSDRCLGVEFVRNEKGVPCRSPLGRLQGLGFRFWPQSLRASARVSSRCDLSNGIP